ncbi:MAG: tetratricopeptide repeat protein [Alphaproteobacteria bacterium]|nr:tetratricopeptide repeat protein [Alphaproteobacteria bacterium]
MNSSKTTDQGLRHAAGLHRDGRLKQAVAAYRSVLKRDPGNFQALYYCAMAQTQFGDLDAALKTITKALKRAPDSKEAHNAAGNIHAAKGRRERAAGHFRKALELDPDFADALFNLGNARAAAGEAREGAQALERAVSLRPDWTEARIALGNALMLDGKAEAALACFDDAISRDPGQFIPHYNRGNALKRLERHEDAIAAYREAARLNPDFAEAGNNIGTSLAALDRHEDAIAAFLETLEKSPGYARAFYNLGRSQMALGRPDEAIASYRRAVAADPDLEEAWYNLARALVEAGEVEDGIACYRKALALDPDDAVAALNLGLELLGRGDFVEGWRFYEGRLRDSGHINRFGGIEAKLEPGQLAGPEALGGDPILIIGEQGLGDEIMFASLIPDVMARVKETTLVVDPRLVGLFGRSFPNALVYPHDKVEEVLDRVPPERRCFIGSLAGLFRRNLDDFPGKPYLVPDAERVAGLRERLAAFGPEKKIGVMWRGGVGTEREARRSLALADFAPLFAHPAQWVSLSHLDAAIEETGKLFDDTGLRVHHWPEITASADYDDTAALIAALDAVISVTCTAAHCAAALGAETYVLVPERPEWRYGASGTAIPWYGAMTLYRRQDDDWPLDEVARAVWGNS